MGNKYVDEFTMIYDKLERLVTEELIADYHNSAWYKLNSTIVQICQSASLMNILLIRYIDPNDVYYLKNYILNFLHQICSIKDSINDSNDKLAEPISHIILHETTKIREVLDDTYSFCVQMVKWMDKNSCCGTHLGGISVTNLIFEIDDL